MKIEFTKMNGCGNDYIYLDRIGIGGVGDPESLSVRLSDRRCGIGADGLVQILDSGAADAAMRMRNADGSEGLMCGNAIRCVAKYLYDRRIVRSESMRIETASGVREVVIEARGGVAVGATVHMGRAELRPERIPARLSGDSIIDRPVRFGGEELRITCVSMGNPHAVAFADRIEEIALSEIGPRIENDPIFPERVNAGFAEIVGRNRIKLRVWERGSGATRACGTAACAAAVAAVLNGRCDGGAYIAVTLPGGELTVRYEKGLVELTGDCVYEYEGVAEFDPATERGAVIRNAQFAMRNPQFSPAGK